MKLSFRTKWNNQDKLPGPVLMSFCVFILSQAQRQQQRRQTDQTKRPAFVHQTIKAGQQKPPWICDLFHDGPTGKHEERQRLEDGTPMTRTTTQEPSRSTSIGLKVSANTVDNDGHCLHLVLLMKV